MTPSRLPSIDINTADEAQLTRALKISPRLAQRIMRMRPFRSADDLKRVWGLDPAVLETLTALLPAASPAGEAAPEPEGAPGPVSQPESEKPAVPAVPSAPAKSAERAPHRISLSTTLIMLAILLAGAWLRLSNLDWDAGTHQHPDERFMTIVAERIKPVDLVDYFDTENSSLNPFQNNAGYTYGMLPLFITRAVGGWLDKTHYDEVVLVGRALSAFFDLAALFMLFVLGNMLFNRRVGLLAAALYAVAVLPIQLSHYFAVDSFATVFLVAGFIFAYQAVPLLPERFGRGRIDWYNFALFGLVTGLAMACKLNTIAYFGVIILASLAHLVTLWGRKSERWVTLRGLFIGLLITAGVAFVVFRVTNPYTFMGPSIYGLKINERWYEVLHNVTEQVAGNSEWPPNHHWTSRSQTTYAWWNITAWGLGWPLGLAAWLGLLYAAWRCFKGEWRQLMLLIAWVAAYFLWQNIQFWRYMRYFLPVYPFLILLGAWALVRLWDWARASRESWTQLLRERFKLKLNWKTLLPGALAGLALASVIVVSGLYALGFTDIYRKPITRIQASQWMLENIRGPLNVEVVSSSGQVQTYPIASPARNTYTVDDTTQSAFVPRQNGTASRVSTVRVSLALAEMRIAVFSDADMKNRLAEGVTVLRDEPAPETLTVSLPAFNLKGGTTYYLAYTFKSSGAALAAVPLLRSDKDDAPMLALDFAPANVVAGKATGSLPFTPTEDMEVKQLIFDEFSGVVEPAPAVVEVTLASDNTGEHILAKNQRAFTLYNSGQPQTPEFTFEPVELQAGQTYYLRYKVLAGGPMIFEGETYTLETSWDDSLPLSIKPYSLVGGVYNPLNFQLYEPDTEVKRERMLEYLARTDYLVLPSNRSYDSMPRLTQRYPLTTLYYQVLFGCSCSGDELEALAATLEPPFHSDLGFDLVASFTHHPSIGPFEINDQLADESFTVYDHPKVMIFKKSADFDIEKVRALFQTVDLSQAVMQAPKAVSKNPTGYIMPADRAEAQRAGGTWSAIFNSLSALNTSQALGALVWYLTILLISLLFLPSVLTVFCALPDRGYPLARIFALVAVGWAVWLIASLKLAPFTRWLILAVVLVFAAGNVLLAFKRREELLDFIKTRWRQLLAVEGLFALLFLFGVSLRLGNPDLWQPWMGGEKPMNFAIFNSVLKSVYFPPNNPWLSGYFLNYYYYGYVLAAVPTKLLGILPPIAFNLVEPTWFAMTGLGAFSVAANLAHKLLERGPEREQPISAPNHNRLAWIAGLSAVVLMLFLGNLHQARQLWDRLPEAAGIEITEQTSGVSHLMAALNGAGKVARGEAELPDSDSYWYFKASRPILPEDPNNETPIAEFPLFTYIYGDLHPHLLVMPILFAGLAWLLALFAAAGQERPSWLDRILFWAAAGLILGLFRGAHTWDYLTLMGLALVAAGWTSWLTNKKIDKRSLIDFAVKAGLLLVLSVGMYFPFSQWFITGYNSIEFWDGSRTPVGDYLTVHGVFLFILVSFLLLEVSGWMGARLAGWKANRYDIIIPPTKIWLRWAILLGVVGVGGYIVYVIAPIVVLVVPLLVWIGATFFKKGQTLYKQLILALFALGLVITLAVEFITLKGDVGRMNVVFRFYMQVWAIFSAASAGLIALLISRLRGWKPLLRWGWSLGMGLLLLAAAMYPLTAISARANDRWPDMVNPPTTLDGMAYMLGEQGNADPAVGAVYNDEDQQLHLGYDYLGIRWMQENVQGTPFIVEGIRAEYRWAGRYSIYTGLPAVAGWSWHVRQHNSLMDGSVVDKRIQAVKDFYDTADPAAALSFLQRYDVGYVILGDLEREFYAPEGTAKFETLVQQGSLQEAFSAWGSEGSIQIFKVVDAD